MPGKENREELRAKWRLIYDNAVYRQGKTREEALEIVMQETVTVGDVYTFETLRKVLFDRTYSTARQEDTKTRR